MQPLRRRFLTAFAAAVPALAGGMRAPDVSSAPSYPDAEPGVPLEFPRDGGAHPRFRSEWWYVTGWLDTPGRQTVGFQVTFFRIRPGIAEASASRFAPRQLLFAHAAIADPASGRLNSAQRAAREGFGLAGARVEATEVWIDRWSLVRTGDAYRASVRAPDFTLELQLVPTQRVLLEGDDGVSRKGPGPRDASFYYSEPQLAARGELTLAGNSQKVEGTGWLDHEWSSNYLAPGAVGWDWTGINLDDGGALMAFRIRDSAGASIWAGATLRDASGHRRTFAPDEVEFTTLRRWRSPRTGIDYPVAMQVTVGGTRVTLAPLIDDQELDARASVGIVYWEGAVRASFGDRAGGRGYLELTGYGDPVRI